MNYYFPDLNIERIPIGFSEDDLIALQTFTSQREQEIQDFVKSPEGVEATSSSAPIGHYPSLHFHSKEKSPSPLVKLSPEVRPQEPPVEQQPLTTVRPDINRR